MTIEEIRNSNDLTLVLKGRLDMTASPALEEVVRKNLPSVSSLTFDFEELDYVSSAGLRVLLMAEKGMRDRGGILIRNANSLVKTVFKVTGFSEILKVD